MLVNLVFGSCQGEHIVALLWALSTPCSHVPKGFPKALHEGGGIYCVRDAFHPSNIKSFEIVCGAEVIFLWLMFTVIVVLKVLNYCSPSRLR